MLKSFKIISLLVKSWTPSEDLALGRNPPLGTEGNMTLATGTCLGNRHWYWHILATGVATASYWRLPQNFLR